MDPRGWALTAMASQLGHPRGLPGRVVGRMLNRGNRSAIGAAVAALSVPRDAVLADLGFGGGLGLALLLRRVGTTGQVHGVDISTTMLAAATRRYRHSIGTGRLALHLAPIERLPLPTSSIDGAITLNTLYFINDLTEALSECARILKPGGRLVIGLGDPVVMSRMPFTAHGFRIRPVGDVIGALRRCTLDVDEHRRVGSDSNAYHLLVASAPPGAGVGGCK